MIPRKGQPMFLGVEGRPSCGDVNRALGHLQQTPGRRTRSRCCRGYNRDADRTLKAERTENQITECLRLGADGRGRRAAVPLSPGRMAKEASTRTNRTVINPIPTRACYDLSQSRAAARQRTPMKLEAVFS